MSGETLIIIEMTMTVVLCLGFGFYQLWSLDKDKKKARLEKELVAATIKPSERTP